MPFHARLLGPILLILLVFSNSAIAESWRYVTPEEFGVPNAHSAAFEARASVAYYPDEGQWYFSLGLPLITEIREPTLKFINGDGSSRTYSMKPELLIEEPNPELGLIIISIPIDSEALELLQSAAQIGFHPGGTESYSVPLRGSRAAISRAMELVEYDLAVADDEAHAVGQAASDAAQAKARAQLAPTDGVRTWEYMGRINGGTLAENFAARASVADDTISILYFPADDAFYIWFTYNGNNSFSQGHSDRAEIFIRTRDVSGNSRYESDYVLTGWTVAQPDKDPRMPQFVVARLTPEDIRALETYRGNDIGAGYFVDDDWTTYLFPGKNLWQSFEEPAAAVKRTDRLQ